MYVRCPACLRASSLPDLDAADCPACNSSLSLRRARDLGASGAERLNLADAFAHAEGIDLASAYSVLLGLLDLETARSFELDPVPPGKPSLDPLQPEFDPGFSAAVAEGRLSAREAYQRGDRVVYASRLARRHGLTMSQAFDVADNRAPLRTELAPRRPRTTSVGLLSLVAVILVPLLAFVVLQVWSTAAQIGHEPPMRSLREPGPVRPTPVAYAVAAELREDGDGRLTRVRAADPGQVLRAFCAADPERNRLALEVHESGGGWIGVYHERGRRYAIDIARDERGGGWSAGDARVPLQGRPTGATAEPDPNYRTAARVTTARSTSPARP